MKHFDITLTPSEAHAFLMPKCLIFSDQSRKSIIINIKGGILSQSGS